VRLGYKEWLTTLGAVARTMVPFVGSAASGAANRLFCAASDGIYDVSTSGAGTGSQVISFGTTGGDAGRGVSCVAATPAGRFLLYADEDNGLHIYAESTGLWEAAATDTTVLWAGSAAYVVGDRVVNGGNVYTCTVAGTSAASGGPTGTGASIADNTVTWQFIHAQAAHAIGESQADRAAGFAFDTANFAAVMVWKSRVWLVEKGSTRAWYSGINAIYGTYTSFDFGSKMRSGGPLANLYDWSYDGGSGMDSLLVAISTAGDVVIYGGTDPTSAATFGLKGSWSLGGVPAGRNIATANGGELLVLSLVGIVPLSVLVKGKAGDARGVVVQRLRHRENRQPLQPLASAAKTLKQWAIHIHPTDNTMLVLVPQSADDVPTQQLAMSFATKGWGATGTCPCCVRASGTGSSTSGRTTAASASTTATWTTSRLDNTTFTAVAWSILTGFDNLGNARQKKVELIKADMQSQSPNPVIETQALYDLNTTEPAPPAASGVGGGSGWDSATWDASVWGGDYSGSVQLQGSTGGPGISVAIAARGNAVTRTVLNGFHVFFRQGGIL
jgi:hypothetical protein